MEKIVYMPIGIVSSSFSEPDDPEKIRNSQSILVLDEKYIPAMDGIEKFRHIVVLYHIDRSPGYVERVHPRGNLSIPKRGVFATRSPCRPNPIGLTLVEVLAVRGNKIYVRGLDALDKTPILDIKPYEASFDSMFDHTAHKSPSSAATTTVFEI